MTLNASKVYVSLFPITRRGGACGHLRSSVLFAGAVVLVFGLALLAPGRALGQNVTVSGAGGGNGGFATLSEAMAAIGTTGHAGLDILLTIHANLTAGASIGEGDWNSLTIVPDGARTISASVGAAPLIDLNGADRVTIDGLNSGGHSLTLSNTNTGGVHWTSTIRFRNDASHNTVRRCALLGASTGTAVSTVGQTGTILFSTGTTTGNDDNLIEDCDIRNPGALTADTGLPTRAIYSFGSTVDLEAHNSGNTVRNCRIANFWGAGAGRGVQLAAGNHAWTIEGNRFFQGAARDHGNTNNTHRAIHVVPGATTSPLAGSHLVKDNTIGYANAAGTGQYTIMGGNGTTNFRAILFEYPAVNDGCAASTVAGNTIRNISVGNNTNGGTFRGISFDNVRSEAADSVRVAGNTLANLTAAANGNSTWTMHGISFTGSGSVAAHGNSISALSASGTALGAKTVHGIGVSGGNLGACHNTITGVSAGGTANGAKTAYGIRVSGGGALLAQGNTISNLSATGTAIGAKTVEGISATGGGDIAARGNTISDLSASGQNGAKTARAMSVANGGSLLAEGNTILGVAATGANEAKAATGISATGGGGTVARGNIISGLTTTGTSSGCVSHAITITNGALEAEVNGISGLTANCQEGGGSAAGIRASGGTVTALNNTVSGVNASGSGGTIVAMGVEVLGGATATVSWNTLTNLRSAGAGDTLSGSGTRGIRAANAHLTAVRNSVTILSSTLAGGLAQHASVIGIETMGTGTHAAIGGNTVHSLVNTGTTGQRAATGIRTANTGSVMVERNLVHSIVPSAGTGALALTSIATGIQYAGGAAGGTLRNNMVRMGIAPDGNSVANGYATRGLHVAGGTGGMNLYHNSVYVGGTVASGTGEDTHALLSTVTIQRDHRNNIFWNARGGSGGHYAMQVSNAGPTLTSDHNCLRVTGTSGLMARSGAVDHANLAAWQAATERDGSSITSNPQFVNATGDANTVDLHVFQPTPVEGAGILIPDPDEVVDDFDHDARPAPVNTNPDIGADEVDFNILPVELVRLSATAGRSDMLLTWTTLSERASHRFLVERSADGLDFRAIGEVRASGWSQLPIDYRSTDTEPLIGVNYYRLRQEDLDGSHAYSSTVGARFTRAAADLNPWPNPADDRVLVALPEGVEGPVAMEVYDVGGRLVRDLRPQVPSGMVLEIALEGLDAGAYLLRLSTQDGVPLGMGRFVKR